MKLTSWSVIPFPRSSEASGRGFMMKADEVEGKRLTKTMRRMKNEMVLIELDFVTKIIKLQKTSDVLKQNLQMHFLKRYKVKPQINEKICFINFNFQIVQMNEGKQKLEAMRRMLKKKVNNDPSKAKSNEEGINHQSINEPPLDEIAQSPQPKANHNILPSIDEKEQKPTSILNKNVTPQQIIPSSFANPNGLSQQVIREEGQIQDDVNQEEDKIIQTVKDDPPVQKVDPSQSKGIDQDIMNNQKEGRKEDQTQLKNLQIGRNRESQKSQKQKGNIPLNDPPRLQQPVHSTEIASDQQIQKEKSNSKGQNDQAYKSIHLKTTKQDSFDNPHQIGGSLQQDQKQPELEQINSAQIIERQVQHQQHLNPPRHHEEKQGLQLQSIDHGNDPSVDRTIIRAHHSPLRTNSQNQPSFQNQQNNSVHIDSKNALPSGSAPVIKVVLKQLDMIKSSIHNLNVTYRGIEFLREEIKKDANLKKRVKERLIQFGSDDEYDIIRKLVKKSIFNNANTEPMTENVNQTKTKENQNLPNRPISKQVIQA